MKIKNRSGLLALARKQKYTGPADLAKLKAWLADELIELVDEGGDPIDVDAVWAVKAVVGGKDETDPGDEDDSETKTKGVELSEKEAEEYKRLKRAEVQKARGKDNPNAGLGQDTGPAIHGSKMARKAYEARVHRGEAKFADADTAEYVGATLRLASMAPGGGKAYGQRANDEAIVANVVGKAGSGTNNTSYGFFIPDDVNTAISWATEAYGVARRLVNVQRMTRDTWSGNRKTGIVTMGHLSEAGTITATDNTYDRISLVAKEVGCLIRLPTSLLEDSAVNIGEEYSKTFAEAQGRREDQDMFVGDGSATYGGHVGLANKLRSGAYIAQGTSNTWAAQVAGDFSKIFGSVENVDPKSLAGLCSRQYYFQVLHRLKMAAGGNTALNMQAGVGMVGADAEFMGYPIFFTPDLPIVTSTTAKSFYFGDFKGGATLGDRRDLRVDTSEHFYFSSDEYAIRATARIAVNVHSDGRSGTFGNIVCLKNG